MRPGLDFLGRGPALHAEAGCAARAGPCPAPSLASGPPRILAAATGPLPSPRQRRALHLSRVSVPGARVTRGQVSSCGAQRLSSAPVRLHAGSSLLRSADSPARLPDASSVHPSEPRERHDASEPVSSPLSDQRAVRASSGSARPEPWGVTTCLERHRLAKTGTTSAGRGGASGKPAGWSF